MNGLYGFGYVRLFNHDGSVESGIHYCDFMGTWARLIGTEFRVEGSEIAEYGLV